tara:strand:- start:1458 stop:2165 length:708 start_codon:yes stop_codon:yes gene_type:complete
MIDYLLSQVNTVKTFSSLADTKANTLLSACNQNHDPKNQLKYLVIGPSVVAQGLANLGYTVDCVHGIAMEHPNLTNLSSNVQDLIDSGAKYDYVIALDEWLCRAETEQQQIDKINIMPELATQGFYTSVKDYKNMSSRDRFFEENFELKSDAGNCIIIRKRDWSQQDRQAWTQKNYIIQNDDLTVIEPVQCRTMYFKQLAKFSSDAGAKDFQVDKKLMYKPLFSKSFEYIVYISF